jgi:hypothetical protein
MLPETEKYVPLRASHIAVKVPHSIHYRYIKDVWQPIQSINSLGDNINLSLTLASTMHTI